MKSILFALIASVCHVVIFHICNRYLEVPITFGLTMFWTFMGMTWAWSFYAFVNWVAKFSDTYSPMDEYDKIPK